MSPQSSQTALKVASGIVIGFGLLFALTSMPVFSVIILFLMDLIFWPVDGAQSLAAPETLLASAIGGGIMTGWGVALWMLTTRLYPREPELARTLILTSVWTWFIVDSTASTLAGAPLNAVLNLSFLLLFVVPLWGNKDRADSLAAT